MHGPLKSIAAAFLAAALFAQQAAAQEAGSAQERAAELERIGKIAAELLPKAAEATGLPAGEMVPIRVVTRAEVRDYLIKLLDEEYPGDELARQGRCLAALGLMPSDYDIRTGLIELLSEQAGAFYDPRTDTFYSIIDLPQQFKIPLVERPMIAHELIHALQDRRIDLLKYQHDTKDDADANFAFTSVVEGMATLGMFVAAQGVPAASLPNLGKMLRMQMRTAGSNPMMKVFFESPRYMQETLIGPYADGASFVQEFLKANPEASSAALLSDLPASSEQILHFDKYSARDAPMSIDLTAVAAAMPSGWRHYYANTLGEFDVKVLCEQFESTAANAELIAAGWDGIAFSSYSMDDKLIVLGASIWDSAADAEEFAGGLKTVLLSLHPTDSVAVESRGERVCFIIGRLDGPESTERVMAALLGAPAVEAAGLWQARAGRRGGAREPRRQGFVHQRGQT